MYSQASGIEVSDECTEVFEGLKIGKKYSYVAFKISDDKKRIVVDKCAEKGSCSCGKQGYDEFVSTLDEKTPRYIVYSFDYKLKDGGDRDKVVFIAW